MAGAAWQDMKKGAPTIMHTISTIYLYQKFFHAEKTYYWRQPIDFIPHPSMVFAPIFGDRGDYAIEKIKVNLYIDTCFVFLEPLRITMADNTFQALEAEYGVEVVAADQVEYLWDRDTHERVVGLWK